MNPLAALLLPASALVLAGTTVSGAPAASSPSTARGASPPSAVDSSPMSTGASEDEAPTVGLTSRDGHLAGSAGSPGLRGQWAWPLQPRPGVVRPFVRPATKYGAGHRGVDLAGASGEDVNAVEAGTVTHVGRIAGRGTVTVLHASGLRSTYEPVDSALTVGAAVARGDLLGRLEESGSHCGVAACLHLGALRGEVYLDPMTFIVGGRRVRLLPLGQVPDG